MVVALSVAVVLLAAAWPAGGAGAAAGCTVELSWSGQDAAVGSELQLQVRLVGAVDVYAAEVHLRYDPARLEATATRVEAGDLFGGKRTFAALNEVDAVEGKVAYAVTLLGEPAGVTGDGVLCRLKVRAKARGDAGLAIESVRLLDSKAMDIKCSLSVIPLTIDGSAGGGPSPGGGAPSGGSPPAGGVPSGSAPGGTPAGGGTAGGSAGGGGGGGSSPA
ncbi:MAG: cohesin domain-containing protein, partial [Bacillota bacterium]